MKYVYIESYTKEELQAMVDFSSSPVGQSFIRNALDKLRQARVLIDESGRDIRLEIDGGVKVNNIQEIAAAGADTFVAGSAIFNQPDYKTVIDTLREQLASV